MTDDPKHQLSALIDGELEASTARFVLRRLEHDHELAGQWQRWHLIRDCMRRQATPPLRADFAARIQAALEVERQPRVAAWRGNVLRWAGGGAIAASVALAALLAIPASAPLPEAPSAVAVQPAAPGEVAISALTERDLRPDLAPVTQTVSATAMPERFGYGPAVQVDPRIDAWLIRHNAAVTSPMQDSFVPLIPLVSPQRAIVPRAVSVTREPER